MSKSIYNKRKRTIILLFIILIISILVFFGLKDVNQKWISKDMVIRGDDIKPEVQYVKREYGIAIDSFRIIQGRVKRNQYFASLLHSIGISNQDIDDVVQATRNIFDLRKVRSGNTYKVYCDKDTGQNLVKYFVYEHTPVEYLLIHFGDSVKAFKKEKEVKKINKTSTGTISSSLWNTMIENQLNPLLAIELSEIYAWSIDFFGLQPGDSFKVIYEEQYVDTTSIGIGKIHAAYFYHTGHKFYAIPFIQNNELSFFDEEGNSLRKAFLKAPLRFNRISSRFSHSRFHPILRIRRPHYGVDYAAPIGTPVYAIGDGKIIKTGYNKGAGNMIKIRHNSVYTTAYLHLSRYARGIKTGKYIKQGDVIGYVGSTGLSTGPHLDFRFYRNGSPVDPLKVKAPSVEPVKDEYMHEFDSVKTYWIQLLSQK